MYADPHRSPLGLRNGHRQHQFSGRSRQADDNELLHDNGSFNTSSTDLMYHADRINAAEESNRHTLSLSLSNLHAFDKQQLAMATINAATPGAGKANRASQMRTRSNSLVQAMDPQIMRSVSKAPSESTRPKRRSTSSRRAAAATRRASPSPSRRVSWSATHRHHYPSESGHQLASRDPSPHRAHSPTKSSLKRAVATNPEDNVIETQKEQLEEEDEEEADDDLPPSSDSLDSSSSPTQSPPVSPKLKPSSTLTAKNMKSSFGASTDSEEPLQNAHQPNSQSCSAQQSSGKKNAPSNAQGSYSIKSLPFAERLAAYEAEKRERMERLREQTQDKAEEECTFRPTLSPRVTRRAAKISQSFDTSPNSSITSLGAGFTVDYSAASSSHLPASSIGPSSRSTSRGGMHVRRRKGEAFIIDEPHYMQPTMPTVVSPPAQHKPKITQMARGLKRSVQDLFEWEVERASKYIGPPQELTENELKGLTQSFNADDEEEMDEDHSANTSHVGENSHENVDALLSTMIIGKNEDDEDVLLGDNSGKPLEDGDALAEQAKRITRSLSGNRLHRVRSMADKNNEKVRQLNRQMTVLNSIRRRRTSTHDMARRRELAEAEADQSNNSHSPHVSSKSRALVHNMGDRRVTAADHARMVAAARGKENVQRRAEKDAERAKDMLERDKVLLEAALEQERHRIVKQRKEERRMALHYDGLDAVSSEGTFTDSSDDDSNTDSDDGRGVTQHTSLAHFNRVPTKKQGLNLRGGTLGRSENNSSGNASHEFSAATASRNNAKPIQRALHVKEHDPHNALKSWFMGAVRSDMAYRGNVKNVVNSGGIVGL